MARRIEHRSTSKWPAARIHGALIDIDYLKERLAEFGGSNTELVEHSSTDEETHFQIRQGVRAEQLPAVVRTVVGGDLVLDRSESWRYQEPGRYTGEVAAAIPRVPGSITGSMWLSDLEPSTDAEGEVRGSEFVVQGSVGISVPFVAGRVEALAAERIQQLLAEEAQFTDDWLSRHG